MTTLNQARPNREDMTWGAEGDLGGYMLTAEELERATAIVEKQSGYDLYTADQLSQQEIESASAQYHVEQDMEAMAARIDQLLERKCKVRAIANRPQKLATHCQRPVVKGRRKPH